MTFIRMILGMTAALGLSACADNELATRSAPVEPSVAPVIGAASSNWYVEDVRVTVPRSLPTTEADVYYPRADLVWHGDPYGDRYAQVETLMDRGLTAGAAVLHGTRPVIIDVTVDRFHAVTPRTRNTVGGVHNIIFDMVVLDAETGQPLTMPQTYEVDIKAYGGRRALEAERQGFDQKYRIMAHLQQWMQGHFGAASATRTVSLR
ncbi:MAG: DUF6778 family protein [Brevirhabdus sp.]